MVHWKFFVIFNSIKVLIFRHENSLAKCLVSAETRIEDEMGVCTCYHQGSHPTFHENVDFKFTLTKCILQYIKHFIRLLKSYNIIEQLLLTKIS